MSKRIAVFLMLCILMICACGCGEDPEKYREDIMVGQWIMPGDADKLCEFGENGYCKIDDVEYTWKYKKNLLKNLRVDISKDNEKVYELQVFEAEEQGYRYMMNLGTLSEKKYVFEANNAGYINLNHYEKIDLTSENYEQYFMVDSSEPTGEQLLILKPEYEKRVKKDISKAVFDVIYGQADFFVTCDNIETSDGAWGCILNAVGIDKEDKNTDPVFIVGQAKGVLYFDMTPDSAFPVKPKEN